MDGSLLRNRNRHLELRLFEHAKGFDIPIRRDRKDVEDE